ncbi:MAG: hypothetical protein CL724_08925 [Chloroflexi bacterium]|nr:hypothetical protein [Chloroflexota bacterium]|tara:strand:+ start:1320 stop:2072 length:753 start_codon:yes stop_codon:yes gene_type:complete
MNVRHLISLASRGVWPAVGGLAALVVGACNGGGDPLTPAATAEPQATAIPLSIPDEESDLRRKLSNLFTRQEGVEITAIRQAADTGNKGFIAPIVDLAGAGFANDERAAIADALTRLTGQEFDPTSFNLHEDAYRWLGRHPEIKAVPGYASWKGDLYSVIDRRFIDFFYEGVPASVPISGAVWGGVGVDGIPPLDNPEFTGPDGATYLGFGEPVFGISINGDARAYPLRILAWHELSNDVVGGMPIALVY